LFTCAFDIVAATTATRCPITLENLILSDSKGGRVPAATGNGVVPINQPTPQLPTSASPVAGVPGVQGAAGVPPATSSSAGCASVPARKSAPTVWLFVVPLAVWWRRRARVRHR